MFKEINEIIQTLSKISEKKMILILIFIIIIIFLINKFSKKNDSIKTVNNTCNNGSCGNKQAGGDINGGEID